MARLLDTGWWAAPILFDCYGAVTAGAKPLGSKITHDGLAGGARSKEMVVGRRLQEGGGIRLGKTEISDQVRNWDNMMEFSRHWNTIRVDVEVGGVILSFKEVAQGGITSIANRLHFGHGGKPYVPV